MKHYVYQHRRKDTKEIFYIGIGTKSNRNYNTYKSIYYRAHKTKDRNIIWQRIVAKTKYDIEIIFESDCYDTIRLKEIELISQYGKKINKGILSNISDGGEGAVGVNKPRGKDSKFSKTVYQYDLEGNFIKKWGCAQDIERDLEFYANSICNCCNNSKYKTAHGYQWKYFYQEKINSIGRFACKIILQYTKNNIFIKEWNSVYSVEEQLGLKSATIRDCCTGRLKTHKGFVWKYKT